jgi:hypothetical protein
MDSPDEVLRARAAREICPCRAGFEAYESHLDELKALQKDPSMKVGLAALHVEKDALQAQRRLDELAEGYDRFAPGGRRRRRRSPGVATIRQQLRSGR